jgi:hypothetical protein
MNPQHLPHGTLVEHARRESAFTETARAEQQSERATPEKQNKRRNMLRWRESRLRRLDWERKQNRATPRQLARISQLEGLCTSW